MKNTIFILIIFLLSACSSSKEKIDASQFVGDYELRSCFDELKFFPDAKGGCEIINNEGVIKIEMRVDKNSNESVSVCGYIEGDKVRYDNGDLFGEILNGKSFWIYQNNGTVYEFWHGIYNGDGNMDGEYAGRCIAITKKGTRCKRKAEKGSSYCWQHKYNH